MSTLPNFIYYFKPDKHKISFCLKQPESIVGNLIYNFSQEPNAMKKTKLIVIASGIFVLCLSIFYHPMQMSAAPVAIEQTSGKELFEKNCAKCHGSDGEAKTFRGKFTHARNLTTADFQSNTSDEQIADAIRTGPKAMPSFEKKLSADEINALVQYVRTFKK